jgi:type II secretory pathway pseudopilin PulG
MNALKSAIRRRSAMTLIEIFIVIIIISVLALTVSVQYVRFSDSAKTAACLANQSGLKTAITSYWAMNLEYPEEIDDLAPYMKSGSIPACPSGGTYELTDESEVICTHPGH